MADCSSITPKHVDMSAITNGGSILNEAYNDIKEVEEDLKKATEYLGKKSLQYGEGSSYIIEGLIDEIIAKLEQINSNNSPLPREYKKIAQAQNDQHKNAINAENNSREAAAKNRIPAATPDLIVCTIIGR